MLFKKVQFLRLWPCAYVCRWSALEKTFNSRPQTNLNLPQSTNVGLFGVSHLTSPDGFRWAADKCSQQANHLVAEALDDTRTHRGRKMVAIFDELSDCLCQVADLAEFVRFAHPSPEYSQAAEAASLAVSTIVEQMNTNVALYRALRHQQQTDTNDEIDQIVRNLFLFDFEQCGIHLETDLRQKVVELNDHILHLGQEFVAGVSNPIIVTKEQVPASIRNAFAQENRTVVVSGLYADAQSALVREFAYKTFLSPDRVQDDVLTQLLVSRRHLAQLCGFETYAQRALRNSILETPENVMSFLNSVRDGIEISANEEFHEMAEMKQREQPNSSPFAIWDVPYFSHKAKRDRFRINAKEYSPYFSLGACMEGLNMIFQSLYGISLKNMDLEPGEVWSKDVYKLGVVHEDEGLLGYIYCDFYERNLKPNQDCHFTIRGGRVLNEEQGLYQLPVVVLMLNLALPRWSSPTLLTPTMVDNLFHEMGHAMHSMLARTRYQHISGTRCSTDLAEVPSILMEYFSSDQRVIRQFARHYQTQDPMPDHMLERLCASKRLFTATETQLQMFYAALDQIYHHTDLGSNTTTTELLERTQNHYYHLKYVPYTMWQLRFSHLVGYGAKYYSYLVSHAIANLIWQTYFRDDPWSRCQGDRYRRECLAHGGGKPAKLLVGEYLGVALTPALLADSITTEIDENQDMMTRLRALLPSG